MKLVDLKIKKNTLINVTVVALIILLSLTVAILAYKLAAGKDNRTDAQRYYDNKCQSYATQNVNSAKGQIVFIGDSITDLYILDDHYSELPLACYNRGIGGDTTEGVLRRLEVSVFDIEPSVVVLMIGTNDINGGIAEDEILDRYEQIIDEIFLALPDVVLYCMSIIPQNDQIEEYSSIDLDVTTERILSINPKIRLLAEEKGAFYIDLFTHLADADNHLIREYSDDGLHLNFTGLAIWTELIKPRLISEN